MNNPTLNLITAELAGILTGQRLGRIFALSKLTFAVDLRLSSGDFLFISVEPTAPRTYLIKRRLRDLEKLSIQTTSFIQLVRKRCGSAFVTSVTKAPPDRVIEIKLDGHNDLGDATSHRLIIQLTGRSANLFLTDERGFIIDKVRNTFGDGQEIGTVYAPPERPLTAPASTAEPFTQGSHESLSAALDHHYLELEQTRRDAETINAVRRKLAQQLATTERLKKKLEADLAAHGDASDWKRRGDLILANLADAVIVDGKLLVVDYFDDNTPTIELEIDVNESLTVNAERFFKRYTKARNAAAEIRRRLEVVENDLAALAARHDETETLIASGAVDELRGPEKAVAAAQRRTRKKTPEFTGARIFVSSDGFEILVGKAAKDNDQLTFRVAKSSDLWLHAADYPGSHVIVRNPGRGEIPPSTLIEAAQLAAFYSNAREQPKVAVHYTPRKFVNKPKGAAPGLVALASFRTILVEPGVNVGKPAE